MTCILGGKIAVLFARYWNEGPRHVSGSALLPEKEETLEALSTNGVRFPVNLTPLSQVPAWDGKTNGTSCCSAIHRGSGAGKSCSAADLRDVRRRFRRAIL